MKRFHIAILCGAVWFANCGKDSDDAKKPAAASKQTDKDDGLGISIKKNAQERAGIRVEPLAPHVVQSELIAYGKLEEDPSASFAVRAALPGILHIAPGHEWPSLGRAVTAGDSFGRIEPRLSPMDRIGVNTQLAAARADLNAALAAVAAAQTAYNRARALNADNKNISDRALDEAAAKLAAEKAHEAGAQAAIAVLQNPASEPAPVVAERGGDVVEVLAQPGESIEQGAPIVRLARFDRLLARIDLPVGEQLSGNSATARIVPAGFENQAPLMAERVAVAPASDSRTQGISILYRLARTFPGLRPGTAVTARFALPGTAGEGVLIPRSAIVQQDGRTWAYVQTTDERFSRRPVSLDLATPGGFIVGRGFSAGERIVVTGAQSLLSEEFKSQNAADTD